MKTNIKRSIALLLIAASLVVPTGVFAASTADTAENGITGPAINLSLVAPASITYVLIGGTWTADYGGASLGLTDINTNSTSGMTITVKADAFVGSPSGSAPTTVRSAAFGPTDGVLIAGAAVPAGGFTDANTSKVVSSSTGPVTNGFTGFGFEAPASAFTVPGATYTSALHFTATSN